MQFWDLFCNTVRIQVPHNYYSFIPYLITFRLLISQKTPNSGDKITNQHLRQEPMIISTSARVLDVRIHHSKHIPASRRKNTPLRRTQKRGNRIHSNSSVKKNARERDKNQHFALYGYTMAYCYHTMDTSFTQWTIFADVVSTFEKIKTISRIRVAEWRPRPQCHHSFGSMVKRVTRMKPFVKGEETVAAKSSLVMNKQKTGNS